MFQLLFNLFKKEEKKKEEEEEKEEEENIWLKKHKQMFNSTLNIFNSIQKEMLSEITICKILTQGDDICFKYIKWYNFEYDHKLTNDLFNKSYLFSIQYIPRNDTLKKHKEDFNATLNIFKQINKALRKNLNDSDITIYGIMIFDNYDFCFQYLNNVNERCFYNSQT